MADAVSTFNAGASMLGYLYQVRVALLWAIRQSRVGDFSVSVETLDDVSFEANGDPIAVLQTKHSIHTSSGLGDLSPDLWKTLRIWMVGRSSGEVPITAAKFLISTSTTSTGTACAALGQEGEGRDVKAASTRLKHAAATSTNADLKDAFDAFLALDEADREQLLRCIYVISGQPDADAINAQLQAELYHVSLHHQELSVQMVEGWWFKRVIHELVHGGAGIPRAEIDAQISDIQESLKRDTLPIDGEIDALMVALEQLPEFANRPFYRQVEMVGAGPRRIRNAITSYLQAFRQRSAWTRDDLLFDADLRQYDQRLLSEWALLRDQVCDELGEDSGDDEMAKAGRAILKWAEDAPLPIRSGLNVPWVCRGSFHMLAEDRRLGWHPDFEARMQAIFDAPADGAAP
ncbi:ABC-three component system protein [Variovorax sp. GB1P17]|uniref:ABC-three component system protein n=1 Tax=Variovorax sp. GB1P17 TaxID=3443740 RepID=UPI003F476942